jgi:SAM-dependent methyltransferase
MSATSNPAAICPFCGGGAPFREFEAREMMFGSRERFTYHECGECASLHIARVPADLARHYPGDYYSFRPAFLKQPRGVWLRRIYARWVTATVERARGYAYHRHAFLYWTPLCGITLDSRILDLGCGGGVLLTRMRSFGYSDLTGADPYAPGEIDAPGFRVRRAELAAVEDRFDLIMMHHTLEHVADPLSTLRAARERLRPGGKVLVRIPLAGSAAHRKYGADWFNLDAPRHLAIPSIAGMERVGARAGLRLLHRGFDSVESGFSASENYRNDIAGPEAKKTPRAVKRANRRLAREMDAQGEGDSGVFVFAAE